MIDSRTGEVLMENTSAAGIYTFKSGLTQEQAEKLNATGKTFEILHNHPGSSFFSIADIRGLFNRSLATASTVICHDGSIYRIKKLKSYDDINNFITDIYNMNLKEHPNWSDAMIDTSVSYSIIKILVRRCVLDFIER